MKRVYQFCLIDWDLEWISTYECDGGYHQAAEEIVEKFDNEGGEYPDEQVVWIKDITHDTPRRFVVSAETVRHYSAREKAR